MTLKIDWLRGCATALVTPFTAEGAVDDRRLREFIEFQIKVKDLEYGAFSHFFHKLRHRFLEFVEIKVLYHVLDRKGSS